MRCVPSRPTALDRHTRTVAQGESIDAAEGLQAALDQAIAAEDYAEAARLRDMLKCVVVVFASCPPLGRRVGTQPAKQSVPSVRRISPPERSRPGGGWGFTAANLGSARRWK